MLVGWLVWTSTHGFDPSLEIVYWPTPSGTAIRAFPSGAVIPAHTLPYSPLLSVKVAGANLYSKARVFGFWLIESMTISKLVLLVIDHNLKVE